LTIAAPVLSGKTDRIDSSGFAERATIVSSAPLPESLVTSSRCGIASPQRSIERAPASLATRVFGSSTPRSPDVPAPRA